MQGELPQIVLRERIGETTLSTMPYPSSFLIGCDPAAEQRVAELIGDKPARFFALAQRITWGTSQPDRVRVDVPATVARLLALHPQLFVTHLLVAYATRVSDPARADASLVLAQSLCPADHPWRYLFPTDDEWSGKRTPERLHEVIADQVWRLRVDQQVPGTPFYVASHATVLRSSDRTLTVVNPSGLSDAAVAALEAVGHVRTVVMPGRASPEELERARASFPAATLLMADGDLHALPHDLDAIPLRGTLANELVLVHRPSELLIAHELVSSGRPDCGRSFAGRLEDFAFGVEDRLGVQSHHPLLWHDLRALQQGLARILATPFARVAATRWPLTPDAGSLREPYAAVLDNLCSLTRPQHAAMRLSYLWHQPAFLRDVIRGERRSRRTALPSANDEPTSRAA